METLAVYAEDQRSLRIMNPHPLRPGHDARMFTSQFQSRTSSPIPIDFADLVNRSMPAVLPN